MELYLVCTILDREKRARQESIYKLLGLRVALTMLGRGTATQEHLSVRGLSPTEKAVVATIADRDTTARLIRQTKLKLFIDIPGNGIMLAVPIKSIGGASALSILTDAKPDPAAPGQKPNLNTDYELIYVILNEGHSDEVMDAARPAGAGGGTVIAAKGTGIKQTERFMGLSLASEKEVLLIVASASNKAAIMKAIMDSAGVDTPAGAICFSLPVSQVAGLRRLDDEAE